MDLAQTELINMADIGPWERYGLPGLVIFALFVGLYFGFREVLKSNKVIVTENNTNVLKIVTDNNEHMTMLRKEAASDRNAAQSLLLEQQQILLEVHHNAVDSNTKVAEALGQLTIAIEQLRKG